MDWMSNLFIALLFTDITGTLFFLIGMLFKKTLFKHDAKVLRFLTVMTLCAYTVPFVYIMLYADKRITAAWNARSNVNLFYNTPATAELFKKLGIVWVAIFFLLFAYRFYRGYRWNFTCRGNIPEEDEMVEQCFRDICAELGVADKISLYRNDSVDIPCFTYWHGPAVILPLVRYTKKEADVALYHEICHYLEKDLYLKIWGIIVALVHGFNPAAHILLDQVDLVCEQCCDRMSCEKGKEKFTVGEYFRVIRDMLLTRGKRERYQLFALFDTQSNYERRVILMSNYILHGSMKKGAALLLSACFLFGSSLTALAAGGELTDKYIGIAEETSEKESEAAMSDADRQAMEELCRMYDLDPDKVVMMGDDSVEPYGLTFDIKWDVPANRTYMTAGFTEEEGDQVVIAVGADPDDITYQTGIKDPEQIMHYIEGEGAMGHTFDIEIRGRYYFFVTNLSETEELYIEGTVVK